VGKGQAVSFNPHHPSPHLRHRSSQALESSANKLLTIHNRQQAILAEQKQLTELTESIYAYPFELRRRAVSEAMHAKLPPELREMVYGYMFPITQVRIIDAYMPSVRGTMNAIRFIVNDPAPSSHLTLVKKSKLRSFAHHSHLQRKFSAKRWRKN
jgi:hypothetical protein